jgi:hypothetical protein
MKKPLRPKWIFYTGLALLGVAILVLCSLIQSTEAPQQGEYYYSSFIRNNYTLLSNIIFVITAFVIGYYTDLHPLVAGLCLFLVFPITSIVEGIIYKGSHNLIPFEFVMHLIMALPTVLAGYVGKYARKKMRKNEYREQTEV